MDRSPTTYLTYNLRLVRGTTLDPWRITLYDARTGTTRRFASLAHLDAYLHRVTGGAEPGDPPAQHADTDDHSAAFTPSATPS